MIGAQFLAARITAMGSRHMAWNAKSSSGRRPTWATAGVLRWIAVKRHAAGRHARHVDVDAEAFAEAFGRPRSCPGHRNKVLVP